MGSHQPIRKVVAPEIPDKLYFRIGDVASLCEVPAYVLRFWETEFPQLKPNKGGTGQRLYRRKDVELALRIKSLLYDQGYTIPGARQVFKNEAAAKAAQAEAVSSTLPLGSPSAQLSAGVAAVAAAEPPISLHRQIRLRELREDLASLLRTLSSSPALPPLAAGGDARLRPRLVVEPKSSFAKPSGSGLGVAGRSQRDLFADHAPETLEWTEPPTAS